MVAPVRSAQRIVYTFENDGTGVRTIYWLGCEEQVLPYIFVPSLDEARSIEWGWSSLFENLGLEAEKFKWEFSDDSIELSFLDFEFEQTLHIEITEEGIELIQQDPGISFIKE
jgi:hypothetical protein